MDINWICKLHVLVAVGLESNAMQQWLSDQDIVKIALTERRQLHFVIIDSLSVRLARLCKLKEATAFHN